mmetsp:Transcript_4418/g.16725  ORF Transcript_4418/g.16725 Transcript_4418/m.16725 type:complete len:406 (+) Transcript_4418:264-1481(+)
MAAYACATAGVAAAGGAAAKSRPVRVVEAQQLTSHAHFLDLVGGEGDEPLVLRGLPFAQGGATSFTVEALSAQLGDLNLPLKSGPRPRSSSGCHLFVARQGEGEAVLGSSPASWDPAGCCLRSFLSSLAAGSGLYLTTRSAKAACSRQSQDGVDKLVYRGGGEDGSEVAVDPEGYDVLVRNFVPRVPWPLILPTDSAFLIAFWLGAQGNNFGLHSDLFAEQFLVQHQGTKEVLLLLPRDAARIAPFPFLSSPLFYKSAHRSVSNLDLAGDPDGCLRAELCPGDVLYIPAWWWHEVRTISSGLSLSATYRYHTEDSDRFSKVMTLVYQLHSRAQSRKSSGRFAQHLRSFFAYSLAEAEADATCSEGRASSAATSAAASLPLLLVGVASAVLAGALAGFAFGRQSRG